jgi:ABC-type uncharacterized transport system substrate-binding protein
VAASARAQQPVLPVIGFLNPTSPDASAERLRAFRQGLKENGYAEGENVAIEYRWAEGQFDRLPVLAAELVSRRVAVIAAIRNAATAATTTVPIVFLATEDPVKLGLVASLARPGGNATGINFYSGELTAKRLELLRELVPAATRVAVLVNPANTTTTETTLRDVAAPARAMGLQIQVLDASTSREINAAFETFVRERPDALFVGLDPFLNSRRVQLVNLASRHAQHSLPGGLLDLIPTLTNTDSPCPASCRHPRLKMRVKSKMCMIGHRAGGRSRKASLGITWAGLAPADRASFTWRLPSFDHLVGAGEQRRHCGFGSATVEAPTGCTVTSNRLASITKFAIMLTTDTRNGASSRVPATGASVISISRPSERYLTSGVDARWPAIGS